MALTAARKQAAYRARKKASPVLARELVADLKAGGASTLPPSLWTLEDAKRVAWLKAHARGEWLWLCELAERLMRL